MRDGAAYYTHLTFSGENYTRVNRTLCGAVVDVSKVFSPRVTNLKRFTCPSCKVAWSEWVEASGLAKPLTLRRWRAMWRERNQPPIGPPPPPDDRKIWVWETVPLSQAPGIDINGVTGPDGHSVRVQIPANATAEQRQAAAYTLLQKFQGEVAQATEAEAVAAVRARIQKLDHARGKVKTLTSRIKALSTRLKKWQRRLKRMEKTQ